jgi:hypothetical protein
VLRSRPPVRGWIAALCAASVALSTGAAAQDAPTPHDAHEQTPAGAPRWVWTPDANVFFGLNYQNRKFTDFTAWESQNWFMLAGERAAGPGQLSFRGMLSLEAFTLKDLGSPQVFQTGEAYRGGPLIDYQHPHDLLMELGIAYRRQRRTLAAELEADLVGKPALGPTPFMHRRSARDNPQVPLTHHYLDATHLTAGVIRGGIRAGGVSVESSLFRGREPNEHRLNIERPRLDSWSIRGGYRTGPWQMQVSGGRLNEPEQLEPFDMTRLTASVEFDGMLGATPLAATLAWGQNREVHGILDGYLFEWHWQAAANHAIYGRTELMAKSILGLGSLHPAGFRHFHPISRIAAGTLGYMRELSTGRWKGFGAGADVTLYHTSDDLQLPYGSPRSFHVFIRWRPSESTHVH